MRLLLVEDDLKLAGPLLETFKEQGFLASLARTRNDLVGAIQSSHEYDVVIMDRLLGQFDSKQLMPELRRKWPNTPLIILSAISTPNERTDLLNLGADDYLGKPFSTHELVARIRVQLRRAVSPVSNYFKVGDLIVDCLRRAAAVGEKSEILPTREFNLLRTLAAEPARVWSKDELLDYVWGQTTTVDTNVVEATIANLRRKLAELGSTVKIRNLRNAGYWITQ